MKILTKRISIIILTICLVFINIFASYKVAFASPVPDPMAIEDTFRLIEGGLQNITYPVGADTWSLGDLVSVGIAPEYSQQIKGSDNFLSELFSVNNGTQNIAWEKLKNVAVVEPAKLVKYIMWDKPQEYLPTNDDVKNALKQIGDKTGAAVTLLGSKIYNDTNSEINATAEALAESYLYVNDGFIQPLKEAASKHVNNNQYYQNISDMPATTDYSFTGGLVTFENARLYSHFCSLTDYNNQKVVSMEYETSCIGNTADLTGYYNKAVTTYPSYGLFIDYTKNRLKAVGISSSGGVSVLENLSFGYVSGKRISYNYKTGDINYTENYNGDGSAYLSWYTNYQTSSYVKVLGFSTNLPLFANNSDAIKYYSNLSAYPVNAPTYEKEKIVVPLQYPQSFPGVVNANPYAFQDYISYIQQMEDALTQVINNLKTNPNGQIVEMPYTTTNPLELPFQYPDGTPVNSPSISPITTPISIPEIVPPIEILPNPTDDEGDNPSGDNNNNKDNDDDDFDLDDDNGDPLLDLSNFFPFCLPHDFMTAIKLLAIEGEPPVFEIPLKYNVLGNPVEHTVIIDIMKPGTTKDNSNAIAYVKYLRWFQTIAFIIAMIFITIKITPH